MIRILILSFSVLAGGALLFELIRRDSGYILISIANTSIELSFWFGVVLVVVLYLAFLYSWRILTRGLGALRGSFSWVLDSRRKQAELRTHRGFIHFIEGNWGAAKKDLLSAAKKVDKPLVHYLAAARSAYELGDRDSTRFLLSQAEKVAPENELAIAISQARIQLLDKQYEQSLATLTRARERAPRHPVILDLLTQVYWHLKDWKGLIDMLPALKSSSQLSDAQLQQLEERIYSAYIDASRQNLLLPGTVGELQNIDSLWQSVPKNLRKNPLIVKQYVQLLVSRSEHEAAGSLLRATLNKEWDSDLVALFGKLEKVDAAEQLVVAEAWLREHPGDAELLLCLGRVCMRHKLWGKAKDYLHSSLKLKEQPATYAELAKLYAALDEHKESSRYFEKGLLSVTP